MHTTRIVITKFVCRLIESDVYLQPVLSGLVVSIGGLTESLVKQSWTALHAHILVCHHMTIFSYMKECLYITLRPQPVLRKRPQPVLSKFLLLYVCESQQDSGGFCATRSIQCGAQIFLVLT
jgi:hypothetical protein